jgi:hypothetical protein
MSNEEAKLDEVNVEVPFSQIKKDNLAGLSFLIWLKGKFGWIRTSSGRTPTLHPTPAPGPYRWAGS